jgi:hypothetical protein
LEFDSLCSLFVLISTIEQVLFLVLVTVLIIFLTKRNEDLIGREPTVTAHEFRDQLDETMGFQDKRLRGKAYIPDRKVQRLPGSWVTAWNIYRS